MAEYTSLIDEILDRQSWIDYTENRAQEKTVWRSFFPDMETDELTINVLQDADDSHIPEIAHLHSRDAMPEQDHGHEFATSIYNMVNVQKEHTVDLYELEKLRRNYAGDALAQKVVELCFNNHGNRLMGMVDARIDLWIARALQDGKVETFENGVHHAVDYRQPEENRVDWDWSDPTKSNPVRDFLELQEIVDSTSDGYTPDAAIMPKNLVRLMSRSVALRKNILGVEFENEMSPLQVIRYFEDQYGIAIYTADQKYKDWVEVKDGSGNTVSVQKVTTRYLDEDKVIFLPRNELIGHTAFGPNTLDTGYAGATGLNVNRSGKIGLMTMWDPIRRKQLIRTECNFMVTGPYFNRVGTSTVKTTK